MKMDVTGQEQITDDVSIVSGSTNRTDGTKCLQIPYPGRKPDICSGSNMINSDSPTTCLMARLQNEDSYRTVEIDSDLKTRSADGCEMSPLVPVQFSEFTQNIAQTLQEVNLKCETKKQNSPTTAGSESEMSEPLIPVISKKSISTVQAKKLEAEESQFLEESQSLLPQIPCLSSSAVTYRSVNDLNSATKSGKEDNSSQWIKGDNPSISSSQSTVSPAVHYSSKEHSDINSEMQDRSSVMEYCKGLPNKTASFESLMNNKIEGSDISLSQSLNCTSSREGEISQSQGTVTLSSQEKDPVSRILSRLDRLVSSLDKVPRRQMMVVEATVLQCITSLQDSLNNRLKKSRFLTDTTGVVGRLLSTTQAGLTKLTEQHKNEKSRLAVTGNQSTQQTYLTLQNQSAVNDLRKRQKRVFDLLKRQKYLVEFYKITRRSVSETCITESEKTDCNTCTNTEKRQTRHTERNKRNCQQLERPKKGCLVTTRPTSEDVLNQSVVSSMRKTLEELNDSHYKRKADISNLMDNKPEHGQGIRTRRTQYNDKETRARLGENKVNKGKDNAEVVVCCFSQDEMTVPDTQEFNTQETSRTSVNDIFVDKDELVTENTNTHLPGCTEKEEDRKTTAQEITIKNDTDIGLSVLARPDTAEARSINNRADINNSDVMKRFKTINVEHWENVKKPKLNKDICLSNNSEKTTANAKETSKLSEVSWLNMVRDNENKVQDDGETVETMREEMFTASKLNLVEERPSKMNKILNVNEDKTEFSFTKPALISIADEKKPDSTLKFLNIQSGKETNITKNTSSNDIMKFSDKQCRNLETYDKGINAANNDEGIVIGLCSPPNATIPGDTWHNVSPTATSMSSDVFMVKFKDLQKRWNKRAMLSEIKSSVNLQVESTESQRYSNKVALDERKELPGPSEVAEKYVRKTKIHETVPKNTVIEKDSISETIDSVIKQSREITAGIKKAGTEESGNTHRHCSTTATSTQHKLRTRLPTLKDFVLSGQLIPGKAVLSCYLEGKTHRASLTSLGKIRTQEGLVFLAASQWVSTLTDGVPVKKRKAYEMVLYKGRQLLSFCKESPDCSVTQKTTQSTVPVQSVDQAIQVEDSEFFSPSQKMSEDEKKLSALLSNCVVRLLTELDFVPCHDLPDNFWTEDFSKVRLHKDTWDIVNAW